MSASGSFGGEKKNTGIQAWPTVAVVILNWNGWEDTIECLESLKCLNYPNFQIIVVDNGSADNSVEMIKKWCKSKLPVKTNYLKSPDEIADLSHVEYKAEDIKNRTEISRNENKEGNFLENMLVLIHSMENIGFTGGNNVAIKYALNVGYDLIWLLNNDTVVHKNALMEMVRVMESDDEYGMLGSSFIYYDENKKIEKRGRNREISTKELKWISGASLLIRRKVIEQIGLLDEKYFLYWEDKDWCLRARLEGWKIGRALKSVVYHKWGRSTGSKRIHKHVLGKRVIRISRDGLFIPLYYETRNGVYYIKKFFPHTIIPYLILRTIHMIIQVMLYDDFKSYRLKTIWRGIVDGMGNRMGKTIDPLSLEIF